MQIRWRIGKNKYVTTKETSTNIETLIISCKQSFYLLQMQMRESGNSAAMLLQIEIPRTHSFGLSHSQHRFQFHRSQFAEYWLIGHWDNFNRDTFLPLPR